ncbi:MAG TPA: hypothetical protein DD624_04140 [Alphaproteobacteria bacterium]|nr:hypothetical protein [Alphaproteobacteria bacterium]
MAWDMLKSLGIVLKYAVGLGAEQRLPPVLDRKISLPAADLETCVGCKLCARVCPPKAFFISTVKTENGWKVEKFKIDAEKCVLCSLCIEACPKGALSVEKGEMECP